MAKLDKSQQMYALNRIDQMVNAIKSKYSKDSKLSYEEKDAKNKALVELLIKKGFEVKSEYNLYQYVDIPATAKQKAAIVEGEKKVEEAKSAAELAKDQIMLGDSAEVTAILAELAKKLGV